MSNSTFAPGALVLVVIVWAGFAFAQVTSASSPPQPAAGSSAPPQPLQFVDATDAKLDVVVDERMTATLELAGAGAASYNQCEARAYPDALDYSLYVEFAGGTARRAGPSTTLSQEGQQQDNANRLLIYDTLGATEKTLLICRKGDGHDARLYMIHAGKISVPRAARSADPVVAPDEEWVALDGWYGARLHSALGTATSCAYKPDGAAKSVTCRTVDGSSGVRLVFTEKRESDGASVAATPSGGQVSITFSRGSTVTTRIEACVFTVTGAVPMLVQGARRQRLALAASPSACAGRLLTSGPNRKGAPMQRAVLVVDKDAVSGTVGTPSFGDGIALDLESVPEKLTLGWQDAELRDASDRVRGRVRVQVVPGFMLGNDRTLRVSYADQWFEARQKGISEKGIAVVDPSASSPGAQGRDRWQITNVATLTGPENLPGATRRERPAGRIPEGVTVFAYSDYVWRVTPATKDVIAVESSVNGPETVGDGCLHAAHRSSTEQRNDAGTASESNDAGTANESISDPSTDGGPAISRPSGSYDPYASIHLEPVDGCFVAVPNEVRFRARAKSTAPVSVRLELYGIMDMKSAGRGISQQPLLAVDVGVASETRPESVPFPIGTQGAMYARCDGDGMKIMNAQRRGIDEDALRIGECWLEIDAAVLAPRQARIFGPQTLLISVKRDGANEAKRLWTALPDDDKKISLPAPVGDEKGSGPYTVEVRVAAEPNEVAVYRPGNEPKSAADVTNAHPELTYTATLNPRGPFATGRTVRMFLTVPVDLSGIRLPANPRDLRTSDSAALYQYIPPTVGLLYVLEPWDYDRSRNSAAGLRANLGAHFFKLTGDTPSLSTVVGISWSLPLFDAPSQLGTTANINAYYEKDWRSPLGQGHYVMITTGVNILSLLAGK